MRFNLYNILALGLVAFALTACNEERELASTNHSREPLVLSVGQGTGTRASFDGTWDAGDTIALQIGDQVKAYVIGSDLTTATVSSKESEPFYWTQDELTVKGWCYKGGKAYAPECPTKLNVPSELRAQDSLSNNDFLYCPETTIRYNGEASGVTFYHQFARVEIRLKYAVSADLENIWMYIGNDTTGSIPLTADYTPPVAGETQGTFTNLDNVGFISPIRNIDTENQILTLTALMIPGDYSKKKLLTIYGAGTYARAYYIPQGTILEGGKTTVFNVTMDNRPIGVDIIPGNWAPLDASLGSIPGPVGFSRGDMVGVYLLSKGEGSNTAYVERQFYCTMLADGTWELSTDIELAPYVSQYYFLAYYPYQPNSAPPFGYNTYSIPFNEWPTTAQGFFSEYIDYIASFEPQVDQASVDNFKASDFQVSLGTYDKATKTITFNMEHTMGLAWAKIVNQGNSLEDYELERLSVEGLNVTPYLKEDGIYYIINPNGPLPSAPQQYMPILYNGDEHAVILYPTEAGKYAYGTIDIAQ